jgi:Peptidase family M41
MGQALAATEQRPTEERYNYNRADLLAGIDVMLGGRESEAIAMGDITTGAEKDLVQATRLVRHMITRWGWGVWALWRFRRTRNSRFSATNWLRGVTTAMPRRLESIARLST